MYVHYPSFPRKRESRRRGGRRKTFAFLLCFVLACPPLPAEETTKPQKKFLLIQIDGLSHTQLKKALSDGRMPNVERFLKEDGKLYPMYSGLPSTTAAMQAELLYGVRTAVPAYGFKKRRAEEVLEMSHLAAARIVEAELEKEGPGLLKGGSAYSGIYTGGARESYFCAMAVREGWEKVLFFARWYVRLAFRYPFDSVLGMVRTAWELVPGTIAAAHGCAFKGMNLRQEFYFIFLRLGICVWLREVITLGARRDMRLGVPVIMVNYVGYDEAAHRRGPSSEYARRFLRPIDQKVGQLLRAAKKKGYTVCLFSDHGQEDVKPYPRVGGASLPEKVKELAEKYSPESVEDEDPFQFIFVQLGEWTKQIFGIGANALKESDLWVVAMGPVAHVYLPKRVSAENMERLATDLVRQAHVPVVLISSRNGAVALTGKGRLRLPEDSEKLLGGHPFREELADDIVKLCRHPDSGQLILAGWAAGHDAISLANENGAHGGMGPRETDAFLLAPSEMDLPRRMLRAGDLRRALFDVLGSDRKNR